MLFVFILRLPNQDKIFLIVINYSKHITQKLQAMIFFLDIFTIIIA